MSRRAPVYAALAALLVALAVSPAAAHKQSIKVSIGPVAGSTSPIEIKKAGALSITGFGGGTVILTLKNMRDANNLKLNAFDNELRMDLRVNGVPTSVAYPFDIKNGKGTLRSVLTPQQDLYKGDLVEVIDVDVVDSSDRQFGAIGVPSGTNTPIFKTSLVYVIDSASPIHFSRGGDSRLKLRDDGHLNSGFDTLLDELGARITSPGVHVEIVVRVNGGAPELRTYQYDIVHGRSVPDGRPYTQLGFTPTDTVEVQRLDIYDNASNRFATLGLKIIAPKMPMP